MNPLKIREDIPLTITVNTDLSSLVDPNITVVFDAAVNGYDPSFTKGYATLRFYSDTPVENNINIPISRTHSREYTVLFTGTESDSYSVEAIIYYGTEGDHTVVSNRATFDTI